MLSRRLQILLDEDRYLRLAQRAQTSGRSVAALVRDAIDQAFPHSAPRRKQAAQQIASASGMEAGDPGDLRRELEELRSRHG
jgi:hypothetical protein